MSESVGCHTSHLTETFVPISGIFNFILLKVAIFVVVVDYFIVNSVIWRSFGVSSKKLVTEFPYIGSLREHNFQGIFVATYIWVIDGTLLNKMILIKSIKPAT